MAWSGDCKKYLRIVPFNVVVVGVNIIIIIIISSIVIIACGPSKGQTEDGKKKQYGRVKIYAPHFPVTICGPGTCLDSAMRDVYQHSQHEIKVNSIMYRSCRSQSDYLFS